MHKLWEEVLSKAQTSINKQSFDMWLRDTIPVSNIGNSIQIKVPDEVAQKHITEHYLTIITGIISGITGENSACEFIISNGNANNVSNNQDISNINIKTEASELGLSKSLLNPEYTFDNFVVGPNNQLAHAAAISVSRAPATQYNPLFLYGGTGLGKTHLMQAIGHFVIIEKPYLKVRYVSIENYLNEFIQAIRTGTTASFKIKYRDVDILLIDDIQFIEKKEQTQEEFFHTFNTLHNNKKQIIISSDRPPKALSTLEDRLRTRFEWGLITDIQPPNLETREAILRNKSEKYDMDIPDDVLNYVARRIKSNIRALESALARLYHVSKLTNEPVIIQHAKTHLKDLFDGAENRKISVENIMEKISDKFDVTVEDLVSKSRQNNIVQPRFIAMYLTRKLTGLTTTDIGKKFGNRDHSTVLNATSNIEKLMKENEDFHEHVEDIISELKN